MTLILVGQARRLPIRTKWQAEALALQFVLKIFV
jgi:hypothetical protein